MKENKAQTRVNMERLNAQLLDTQMDSINHQKMSSLGQGATRKMKDTGMRSLARCFARMKHQEIATGWAMWHQKYFKAMQEEAMDAKELAGAAKKRSFPCMAACMAPSSLASP